MKIISENANQIMNLIAIFQRNYINYSLKIDFKDTAISINDFCSISENLDKTVCQGLIESKVWKVEIENNDVSISFDRDDVKKFEIEVDDSDFIEYLIENKEDK